MFLKKYANSMHNLFLQNAPDIVKNAHKKTTA